MQRREAIKITTFSGLGILNLTCFSHPFSFLNSRDNLLELGNKMIEALIPYLNSEFTFGKIEGIDQRWNQPSGDPEMISRSYWLLATSTSQDKFLLKSIKNFPNPDITENWLKGSGQLNVESGNVGWTLYKKKKLLKDNLNNTEWKNLEDWLIKTGKHADSWALENNWALFYILNHTGRKKAGMKYDQSYIDHCWEVIDKCYVDKGWYSDGFNPGKYDDYLHWVFYSHQFYWIIMDGDSDPKRKDKIIERASIIYNDFPSWFSSDGGYPEYGRSLSYKFARLVGLILAYHLKIVDIAPGLLKTIVSKHINYYLKNESISEEFIASQRLTKNGSLNVRESYIAPGSTYWLMQTFGPLQMLESNDPFWNSKEKPLPVESKSYTKFYEIPGFIISGSKRDGITNLINIGVTHNKGWQEENGSYPDKYRKNLYNSYLGYLIGNKEVDCPDNVLLISKDNKKWHYPIEYKNWHQVNENQYSLSNLYNIGDQLIEIKSQIIILENNFFTFHSLTSFNSDLFLKKGGFAIGSSTKDFKVTTNGMKEIIETGNRISYTNPLLGFTELKTIDHINSNDHLHTKERYFNLTVAEGKYISLESKIFAMHQYGGKEEEIILNPVLNLASSSQLNLEVENRKFQIKL